MQKKIEFYTKNTTYNNKNITYIYVKNVVYANKKNWLGRG